MKKKGVNIYQSKNGKAFTVDKRTLWDDIKFYSFFPDHESFYNFLKSSTSVFLKVNSTGWQDISYGITPERCEKLFRQLARENDCPEKIQQVERELPPEKEKIKPKKISVGEQMDLF